MGSRSVSLFVSMATCITLISCDFFTLGTMFFNKGNKSNVSSILCLKLLYQLLCINFLFIELNDSRSCGVVLNISVGTTAMLIFSTAPLVMGLILFKSLGLGKSGGK